MIYLDNAATSFPKAPGVSEAVANTFNKPMGNANRSSHYASIRSTLLLLETRELIAELLKIKSEERVIFTPNATTAINMAISGLVKPGMKVLTSPVEHNSVMRPLRYLEQQGKIELIKFDLDDNMDYDKISLEECMKLKPDLLISTAASNVTGGIISINSLSKRVKEIDCKVIIDGSQLFGSVPVDLSDDNIDIFCFPGHKGLMGPSGTGGMYISDKIDIAPLIFGGTGSVSDEESQPDFYPDKLESGTHNLHGLAGLNAALKFLAQEKIEVIQSYKSKCLSYMYNELLELEGLSLLSASPVRNCGAISVIPNIGTIDEFTEYLDRKEIAVRMGLHCSPSTHKYYKTYDAGGAVRFSPGYFTSMSEIDTTIEVIKQYLNKRKK